jgi:hypothetical protein
MTLAATARPDDRPAAFHLLPVGEQGSLCVHLESCALAFALEHTGDGAEPALWEAA